MNSGMTESGDRTQRSRRQILRALSATGVGTAVFHRALAQEAVATNELSRENIRSAEWIAGVSLSDEQRDELVRTLARVRRDCEQIRAIELEYSTLPAFRFDPESVDAECATRNSRARTWLSPHTHKELEDPAEVSDEVLPWLGIRQLGRLLRSGRVTSMQLTELCLRRLEQHDATLKCVVTMTRELALQQAQRADEELKGGHDRGPLHGIPWGAKDLIAVSGYPTTWGAPQFREQKFADSATVVKRLELAGAVLVAKLSLGALAMGDQWFGGQTRNPWNPEQGSSGSSAGSASAVAAGLVPFAMGSETLGSIISPSRRCAVAGLRPTFGRVSRAGCMPLSWTMDKIGPLARTAEDCGYVFSAIHGKDAQDPTTVDRWFEWPMRADLSSLRIGRVVNAPASLADQRALAVLKAQGASIVDVELPREIPEWALATMLDVEAASVFESLTRGGNVEGLNSWPSIFLRSHFVSAVDFLHAARARTVLMRQMAEVFGRVDVYIGGDDLGITNLTGHPSMAFPVMLQEARPQMRPICCTLTAGLHDEATLLAVANLIETCVELQDVHPAR